MASEATTQKEKPPKKVKAKKAKILKAKVGKAKSETKTGKQYQHFLKCPLCLDNMKKMDLVCTKCGHVFCKKCLQKALISKPRCPMCRKRIVGQYGYHPIYLTENLKE